MSRIYVFGVGGTGSRVLRALTMVLSAGVKINTDEIVPIIIDPDESAGDLTRTKSLMQAYNSVYDKISHSAESKNKFFRTKINLEILPSVTLPIVNTKNEDFKDYIKLSEMKDEYGIHTSNYALASLLFSRKNLNANMEVGFKGHPNIGSVVLNQISMSNEFRSIVGSFNQDDRIFIISSIFGGTGAAGFPLLLKNLRAIKQDFSGNSFAKNSIIGAVSVLPYFKVTPDSESEIDSSTFVSKTKAALSYYERNMTEANALYYVADNVSSKPYDNSEGGASQINNAHFVELVSALAIVNFSWMTDLQTNDGKPKQTVYKEFGINNDPAQEISFEALEVITNQIIKKPFTQFTLLCKYLDRQLNSSYTLQPWAIEHKVEDIMFSSIPCLTVIQNAWYQWLGEMAQNSRAFMPFDLINDEQLFELIKDGEAPKYSWKKNYDLFDDYLNDLRKKVKTDKSKPLQSFVELFFLTTEKLVKTKFRM